MGFSQNPGQGEHIHPLRTCFQQDLRALLHSGSSGKNVIDEEEVLSFNDGGVSNLESATDILLPLSARKFGLRLGMTDALEGFEIQGNGMLAAQPAGQKQGLIESPLPEALRMERNRKDEVELCKGQFRVLIFTQECAQGLGQAGGALVLKARDDLYHQALIRPDGSGGGEVTLFGEAAGAKVIVLSRGYEAQSASRTAGVG